MSTWAEWICQFQQDLKLDVRLPRGVEVLNPYTDPTVRAICQTFYHRYYADSGPRTLIMGINPGRFGGGVTGVPFTDPIALTSLDIPHSLAPRQELSSAFVYAVIEAFGGAAPFFAQFYISSVSPLGFTKAGKNLNYYDDPKLPQVLRKFMLYSLQTQLDWGLRREACFCLGEGENFKFLKKLNQEHHFFDEVIPLPHPRFVMQYRRKQLPEYVLRYTELLKSHVQ